MIRRDHFKTTEEEETEESLPLSRIEGSLNPFRVFENLIKYPERVIYELRGSRKLSLNLSLVVVSLVSLAIYGLVVGLFSGQDQLWQAPLKITAGALLSGVICVPSLYIFLCLSQVDCKLEESLGVLLSILTLTAILLIGFVPVAWVFTVSTESIEFIGALHILFWSVGTYFGIVFLNKFFKSIHTGSSFYLRIWTLIFILVTLQMTSALRPIIGTAETFLPTEKKFFIEHWFNDSHSFIPAKATRKKRQRNHDTNLEVM